MEDLKGVDVEQVKRQNEELLTRVDELSEKLALTKEALEAKTR